MRFVDLSATITPTGPDAPPWEHTEITYVDHGTGAQQIEQLLGVPPALLRDEEGWAVEEFTYLGTHNTTHVDAPWHYNSRVQGTRAQTIDELPLEWFYGDGVCLDFTGKPDSEPVTTEELQAALERIGHELAPLEIVLLHTGRDELYGQPDYIARGCGVTREATHWLFDRGIRVMGIDAWGWDPPLPGQAAAALEAGEPGIFWAAHQADRPYSQIERLVNLGSLPARGFKVACFPLKVQAGSAGPTRAVAILDE